MKNKLCFKKLMSVLLVLTMLLGTLAVLPLAASAEVTAPAWDGTTMTQPAGEGTEASPWKVASAAELAWVSFNALGKLSKKPTDDVVKIYVELTADVNMGNKPFTPIAGRLQSGTDDNGTPDDKTDDKPTYNYAAYIFDGKNHTIANLSITGATSTGLFTYVGNGSSFQNVKLVGANVIGSFGAEGTGALIGEANGYITMYNCHLDATSSVKGYKATGGLLGYMNPGKLTAAGPLSISYCTNAAAVTGDTTDSAAKVNNSAYIGGLIGRIKTDVNATVSYCYNAGTVTVIKGSVGNTCQGGIMGNISESNKPADKDYAAGDTITLQHCVNEGALILNALDASKAATTYNWMGGLQGHFNMGAPGTDEPNPYHTYVVDHCFDYSAKAMTFTDNAGTQINAVNYVNGNHADWQQYKTFKNTYGVKHSGTQVDMSFHAKVNYTAASELDCGMADALDSEVVMSMTKTTPGAEINKIKAAITALDEVKVGGEPISDGLARDYAWYTADGGTKEAPYEIANAAAWVGLVDLSLGLNTDDSGVAAAVDFNNKYFKLTGNIDLTGYYLYPVGGKATIHLDGQNHTISNANFSASAAALFQNLGRHSTVSNIVFDNIDIDVSGNAAILALDAKAGVKCYNLHVKDTCSVKTSSGNAAGLIVTMIDLQDVTEEDYIHFQFCINEADVTAGATIGGLVANLQGSYNYHFDFCVNKGDLTATTAAASNVVGGLFGNFNRRSDAYTNWGTITNCYNTGKISFTADANNWAFIGGLFGCLRAGTGSDVTIVNCFDYSARAGSDAPGKRVCGGVFGNADNTQLTKIISYCHAANNPASEHMFAGVFAWTEGATTMKTDCTLVEALTDNVLLYTGETVTLAEAMTAIDNGIQALTPNENSFDPEEESAPPVPPVEIIPNNPSNGEEETTEAAADAAEDEDEADTEPTAEEGCGSSVTATFAVLALTATCGMAIIGKKKED